MISYFIPQQYGRKPVILCGDLTRSNPFDNDLVVGNGLIITSEGGVGEKLRELEHEREATGPKSTLPNLHHQTMDPTHHPNPF